MLLRAVDLLRPQNILEIGSWKGRSAINIARHAKSLGLSPELVCVDTWLGSAEHWLREGPGWYESLIIRHGHPELYNTFLSNVVRAGLQDIITPFPCTSETAAIVLARHGFYFDLCYVDAAHEEGPVSRDLDACWTLLREPGVLIGDDFGWPGVNAAVTKFAESRKLVVHVDAEKYILVKGRLAFP